MYVHNAVFFANRFTYRIEIWNNLQSFKKKKRRRLWILDNDVYCRELLLAFEAARVKSSQANVYLRSTMARWPPQLTTSAFFNQLNHQSW